MAYVYRAKTRDPRMRRFRVLLKNGKEAVGTVSHQKKLETVKELEKLVDQAKKALEMNEAGFAKHEMTGSAYENRKSILNREIEILKDRIAVREDLEYVGESVEFRGYIYPEGEAHQEA